MNGFAVERELAAAGVLLGYLGSCAALFWQRRVRQRRRARAAEALAPGPRGAAPVLVAYASQTGHAEQIAWQSARMLHAAGIAAVLRPLGELTLADLQGFERALLIASTYGEGDTPDSAAAFARRAMAQEGSLTTLNYGLLALGDSDYRHFCGFGRRLDGWLQGRGAHALFDRVELDNDDPQALVAWQHVLARVAGTTGLPEWKAPAFEGWRLTARRLLNDGSQGNPCFHIELQAPAVRDWQAGDLVQVLAPGDPDRPREYSIASLPEDGAVHLLVRQERHADGALGIASGWLTLDALVGEEVRLRLRPHRNFRIGDNGSRPLLLIGNGTGLAGLRGHLKARARQPAASRAPCCLVFGEREVAHDDFYGEEIAAWVTSGVLARADLVYSRDGPTRRYVQHRLRERASELRDWVAGGCAVYVCGSLQGMAEAVDAALREVLGKAVIDQMAENGRYRRDVY